jgi:hypothetical protein
MPLIAAKFGAVRDLVHTLPIPGYQKSLKGEPL